MNLTHDAFIAILPLLLISSSVLGLVLQNDPTLQANVPSTALAQFPIIGTELTGEAGLQGSVAATRSSAGCGVPRF